MYEIQTAGRRLMHLKSHCPAGLPPAVFVPSRLAFKAPLSGSPGFSAPNRPHAPQSLPHAFQCRPGMTLLSAQAGPVPTRVLPEFFQRFFRVLPEFLQSFPRRRVPKHRFSTVSFIVLAACQRRLTRLRGLSRLNPAAPHPTVTRGKATRKARRAPMNLTTRTRSCAPCADGPPG